jgi:hypothetical protein
MTAMQAFPIGKMVGLLAKRDGAVLAGHVAVKLLDPAVFGAIPMSSPLIIPV